MLEFKGKIPLLPMQDFLFFDPPPPPASQPGMTVWEIRHIIVSFVPLAVTLEENVLLFSH